MVRFTLGTLVTAIAGAGALTCEDGPSQSFYRAAPLDYADAAGLDLPACSGNTAWRVPAAACHYAGKLAAFAVCDTATETYSICSGAIPCSTVVVGSSVDDAGILPCEHVDVDR
jgi:hypothetical protein